MTEPTDRALVRWLEDGPDVGPPEPLTLALAATRTTRQRPSWVVRDRWVWRSAPPAPSLRTAMAYGVAMLALLALVAALVVGAQRKLPPPTGLAGNGLVAVTTAGRLHFIDPHGRGEPQPVPGSLGQDFGTAFSSDGTRVAYWTKRSPGEPLRVVVVDVASGRVTDVTGGHAIFGKEAWPPTWSPDGTRLAFAGRVGGAARLLVANADGSRTRIVGPDNVEPTMPTWSPDGTWIAVFHEESTYFFGDGVYVLMAPDGMAIRGIPEPDVLPRLATELLDGAEAPLWTVDGRILASFSADHGGAVYHFDLAGGSTLVSQPSERAHGAVVAPDGSRVAYMALDAPDFEGPERVRVVTVATGERQVLDVPARRICDLWQWSPDGTMLLGLGGAGCDETVLIDPANGVVETLIGSSVAMKPDWQRVAP